MDIKLKNFKPGRGWRILAFILCVIFFIGTLTTGAMALKSISTLDGSGSDVEDLLYYSSYKESVGFQWEFEEKAERILYLMEQYKSEDYIKSGQSLDSDRVESYVRDLFYNEMSEYVDVNEKYDGYDTVAGRERFKEDYADQIANIREELILRDIRDFESEKRALDKTEGFLYYATDGVNTLTNLNRLYPEIPLMGKEFAEMAKGGEYLIYENGKMTKSSPSAESVNRRIQNNDRYLEDRFFNMHTPGLKVFFAFEENYLAGREEAFQQSKAEILKWIPIVSICGLLSLAALIFLVVMTGRKDAEGNRPLHRIDGIFTEFQLAAIAGSFFGGGFLFVEILFNSIHYNPYHFGRITSMYTAELVQLATAVLIGLTFASIGLLFILSCVRNLKARRFLKNFLVYRSLAAIFKGIASIYHGGSVMRKVILLTLAVCILSATVFLAPVVAALILIFAPKWVKKYEEVRKGVKEVKEGNLTYKISVTGNGELDSLAADINEISEASYAAIQKELKNQRLKTDLISNVSHDLKTPLTSIITYVDLLKNEGLHSENAPQYLEVLDQKSMRLQKLTEDLFDAAKASSGAIPVRIETVDMLSLINQGLGEMIGRIDTSGLDFIINAKNESYLVKADGQLLWRVVENLLGNVLKYALEGSRVYIDIQEIEGINGKEGQVLLEIKNISKDELNINADELLERFKRGDEARSTEGSGLGLAIAKDLVLLQNGWFEIKIDGDLFKAVVMLPKAVKKDPEA